MTHIYSFVVGKEVGQSDSVCGGWSLLTLRKAWPQLAKHEQYNPQPFPAFPLFVQTLPDSVKP